MILLPPRPLFVFWAYRRINATTTKLMTIISPPMQKIKGPLGHAFFQPLTL